MPVTGAAKQAQKAERQERAGNTFETVARRWFDVWRAGKAESHSSKVIARLEHDVFPWLGGTPVADIDAPTVLSVLRRIESRGTIEMSFPVQGIVAAP
jgi:integrase